LKAVPKGTILFRAQRGFIDTTEMVWIGPVVENPIDGNEEHVEEEIEVAAKAALPPERMVPKAEYVGDGRVNPRGIPCLYLADAAGAAISEMRPWVGSYVTLAAFKTARDCLLVDCSLNTQKSF
jgi:hypothetical protein